jgi:hypothetical protein
MRGTVDMNVAYICTDYGFGQYSDDPKAGGSCFYRCVLPARGLTENGHKAAWFTGLEIKPDGAIGPSNANHGRNGMRRLDGEPIGGDWDIIVLKYLMHPQLPEHTLAAKATGQIVIQDVDDDMWRISGSNDARERTDPVRHPNWNRDHLLAGLRVASLVTVTNTFLEAALRREGVTVPIVVIPNAIDLREWVRQPVASDVTRIGWIGMTGFRNGDLEQVGPGVRMFLNRHPEITFVHGGARPDHQPARKGLKVPAAQMEVREQQPMDRYPRLWDWLDIAIAPIAPIEFNLSKTAIKVMEGSAAGVPMLATDFGPYSEWNAVAVVPEKRLWDKCLETMCDFSLRFLCEQEQWERVQKEDLSIRWQDWYSCYSDI